MKFARIIVILSLTVFTFITLSQCTTASAGLAVSNIPLENKPYDVLGPAEATKHWIAFDIGIIGVPLNAPPVDEAVKEVLGKYEGGNALVNLRYYTDTTVILFITLHTFHLKADVVKVKAETGGRR